MEYRGIDVSSWQGVIDWKKVADHGTEFAIIRITEAGNAIDRYFERNYAGCMEYRIPTGVYKFSYALSIDEVRREAEKVIEVEGSLWMPDIGLESIVIWIGIVM